MSQTEKIRYRQLCQITYISGILATLIYSTPAKVLAHGGHNHEFKTDTEVITPEGINVDAETARRMGIIVQSVTPQFLSIGIKTTGQIESLPNQKVAVTSPITGKVVELLVTPGSLVKKGQTVAVLSSPDLAELRVSSQEKSAQAQADLQQALADLQLAQQNLERQGQIATADIAQASIELKVAQEQYDRDRDLVNAGALPRRQMLESQAHLAVGKSQLAKASSRREVIEAEAQLKRAQASVFVAKSRIRLSSAAYEARLQQLGTIANAKGLVTVVAPISGIVAERAVTLGETVTVDSDSKPLMTILNDSRVFATANVYEKDLKKIKIGQSVRVTVTSLPNQSFSGRIAVIGAVVGEARVVAVKAELDNSRRLLKPGMFAQLEVSTAKTAAAVLAIPSAAVVEGNGKQLVYVQNGNNFKPVEVALGETSLNLVEVENGLFDGDRLVTQGAMQLYAQSLRGDVKKPEATQKSELGTGAASVLPWWWVLPFGGVLAVGGFWVVRGSLTNRRGAENAKEERERVEEKC